MELNIPLNLCNEEKEIVNANNVATVVGSGSVEVFATPAMIALMEKTANNSLRNYLPEGCHPWDSPGKNTGVGCHFLLQCMKVKSESEVAQSCPTLCDPMDCILPGSSAHGIFQARVLEWCAIAFSDVL